MFVTFSENLVWPTQKPTIHVCFDDVCRVANNVALNTAPGNRLQIKVHSQPSVGQTVTVSYSVDDQTAANRFLKFHAGNRQVEDFRAEVVVTTLVHHVDSQGRQIPTVYEALGAYFSGKATLFGESITLQLVNELIRDTHGGAECLKRLTQCYHERLLELVDAGRLDDEVPGPQSAWGDPGTEDWAQMGGPGGGSSHTCGGVPQPGTQGRDGPWFFFACTGDGQWVPVRVPRPGVDYSHDHELQTGQSHPPGPSASQFERDCKASSVMRWDPIRETCISPQR